MGHGRQTGAPHCPINTKPPKRIPYCWNTGLIRMKVITVPGVTYGTTLSKCQLGDQIIH